MQCPLCNRILNVVSSTNTVSQFSCYCSDVQDSASTEELANMVLNFEGSDLGSTKSIFSIWLDLGEIVGDTLIFYYSEGAWELTVEHHGDAQTLQSGYGDISPANAVKIMRRCQNLLVFV